MEEKLAHVTAATIPGTTLIAYAEGFFDQPVDLVIFDTSTGTELSRFQILEAATHSAVKLLHARGQTVAISPIIVDEGKWIHQPVLLLDLATGTITELDLEGTATLVP